MAGAQPLSAFEILAYCELRGVSSQDERDFVMRMVRRMDSVFLAHMAKKASTES